MSKVRIGKQEGSIQEKNKKNGLENTCNDNDITFFVVFCIVR
jgi:hypothetical protein